jgi:hypothetical protein
MDILTDIIEEMKKAAIEKPFNLLKFSLYYDSVPDKTQILYNGFLISVALTFVNLSGGKGMWTFSASNETTPTVFPQEFAEELADMFLPGNRERFQTPSMYGPNTNYIFNEPVI